MDDLITKLQSEPQRFINISFGRETIDPIRVPQQTLESLSPYFRSALKKDTFEEGDNGTVTLPEDEFEIWKVLLFWIFNHRLPDSMHADYPDRRYAQHTQLAIRCWIVGDKYQIPQFQDAVMLCILRDLDFMQDHKELLEIDVLFLVLENTTQGSLLQEFFIDWVAVKMHTDSIHSYGELFKCSEDPDGLDISESLDGTGFYPANSQRRLLLNRGDYLEWRGEFSSHDHWNWTRFFLVSGDQFNCRCDSCV